METDTEKLVKYKEEKTVTEKQMENVMSINLMMMIEKMVEKSMEKVIEKFMEILMQKLMEKVIEISGQFSDGDRDGEISNGENQRSRLEKSANGESDVYELPHHHHHRQM
jgi:uncharacterized protein (UPF0305 family)